MFTQAGGDKFTRQRGCLRRHAEQIGNAGSKLRGWRGAPGEAEGSCDQGRSMASGSSAFGSYGGFIC